MAKINSVGGIKDVAIFYCLKLYGAFNAMPIYLNYSVTWVNRWRAFQVNGPSFMPAINCPSKDCTESGANGRLHMQVRGSKFVKFQEIRIQELVGGRQSRINWLIAVVAERPSPSWQYSTFHYRNHLRGEYASCGSRRPRGNHRRLPSAAEERIPTDDWRITERSFPRSARQSSSLYRSSKNLIASLSFTVYRKQEQVG